MPFDSAINGKKHRPSWIGTMLALSDKREWDQISPLYIQQKIRTIFSENPWKPFLFNRADIHVTIGAMYDVSHNFVCPILFFWDGVKLRHGPFVVKGFDAALTDAESGQLAHRNGKRQGFQILAMRHGEIFHRASEIGELERYEIGWIANEGIPQCR